MVDYYNKNTLGQDQTKNIKKGKNKKGQNRSSYDSSRMSGNSENYQSISNKLLSLKTEVAKAHKNSLMNGHHNMSNINNITSNQIVIESSQGNIIKSNLLPHKDTNLSSTGYYLNMDESVAPPMIIDNSAVLFTNTKKKYNAKNPKFKNFKNPLATETGKSEIDYQSSDGNKRRKRSGRSSYTESEGEDGGEGESGSSSCSCSS
jgi:hypothetical protein